MIDPAATEGRPRKAAAPTRRQALWSAACLLALATAGLAGCVAYYPAYPTYSAYPPAPPAAWSPNMVWLPSPGAYVALGYPYPLFFAGGLYYYAYGGRWYSGGTYRGPWRPAPGPPPPLRGFHPNQWGDYQSRARAHYSSNPGWQHFRPPR
jgi:hypothetical protein